MAYQFAHISFFSRKGNSKGQSTSFIFSEARRDPEASTHVENPQPPDVVYGLNVDELEALHDKQASEAKTTNSKGQTRKIRQDQQTLACVVLSYPKDGDGYEEWEKKSLEWLQEKYGESLKSVIRHTDESHPHLHCYLMSDDMKASRFNEGKQAKDAFMSSQEAQSMDKKEANKRGDKAYRKAMRSWQDDYYEKVGIPCGLSRIGPAKRRLSRDAWHAEQKQASYLKDTIKKGDQWGKAYKEKIIKEAKAEAQKILKEADLKLREFQKKIDQKESELKEISGKNYMFVILQNIRNEGFLAGLSKASKDIRKLKSEIIDLKNSSEKEITRLNHYTLKLTSDLSKKETENNKLKREVSELKTELKRYNIDTSPTASYGSNHNI